MMLEHCRPVQRRPWFTVGACVGKADGLVDGERVELGNAVGWDTGGTVGMIRREGARVAPTLIVGVSVEGMGEGTTVGRRVGTTEGLGVAIAVGNLEGVRLNGMRARGGYVG